ncbi:hypothetical protein [Neobacillus sp. PS2-9]|uniref:hypothetical protein n=1 Tax=Neobacillus sp. PS2-9 TaxID=3070676 RepID=UPI0027E161A2|nr:hypothetical protein [Neobacillus sp. PS2-9]WML58540.1 hypothetical protein RCG25_01645 [Neobacillus sp. PS2-9]
MLKISERTKTEKALYLCTLISLLIDLVISWAGYSDNLFGTISSSILAVFILLLLLVLNKKRQGEPMKKSVFKVCYIILCTCFLLSQIFREGLLFIVALILGFSSFATLAVTLLIKEDN